MMRVLAGDIGGTRTRLGVVDLDESARVVRSAAYSSQEYPGLAPIVAEFMGGDTSSIQAACFAIAGPVVNGEVRLSNLPWVVSAGPLGQEIGIARTTLINDFAAIGSGLQHLAPQDLTPLQEGEREEHGVIGVIGAGTGLGEGYLVWDGTSYRVLPSEGGHTTFAARDPQEWGLRGFLAEGLGHVSFERVLSGHGLVEVYRYLASYGRENPAVREAVEAAPDPAPLIAQHGLAGTDPLCVRTLDIFAAAYGAQAGNLALTLLATGGIYLAGGIAPKLIDKLTDGRFIEAFRDKGRMGQLLRRIPVHVIMNPEVGLLGAAAVAAQIS